MPTPNTNEFAYFPEQHLDALLAKLKKDTAGAPTFSDCPSQLRGDILAALRRINADCRDGDTTDLPTLLEAIATGIGSETLEAAGIDLARVAKWCGKKRSPSLPPLALSPEMERELDRAAHAPAPPPL